MAAPGTRESVKTPLEDESDDLAWVSSRWRADAGTRRAFCLYSVVMGFYTLRGMGGDVAVMFSAVDADSSNGSNCAA